MNTAVAAAGILPVTGLFLFGLLAARPFHQINMAMDAVVDAAPPWSQVEKLVRDPRTQEVTHGEKPASSLAQLATYWKEHPDAPKVVMIGNSQMLAMSLAPGEQPSSSAEKTYTDILAAQLRDRSDHPVLVYRLAAPGMSYAEALWYLEYLLCHPDLRPSGIVLQMNYQAFWTSGVRPSLFTFLEDGCFRDRVDAIAGSGTLLSDTLREAQNGYAAARKEAAAAQTAGDTQGFGPALEEKFRGGLQHAAAFNKSAPQKDDFAQMFYRLRLYVLRVKPSNARSIAGPRLVRSQLAVETLVRRCEEAGVKLVLFNAPVNPAVSLYSSDADRDSYHGFVKDLADRHHLAYFDFETAIDGQYWGRQYNSADPLHIGRRGHQLFASKMTRAIDQAAGGE